MSDRKNKRVAPGGNIDEKNIISGGRRRKRVVDKKSESKPKKKKVERKAPKVESIPKPRRSLTRKSSVLGEPVEEKKIEQKVEIVQPPVKVTEKIQEKTLIPVRDDHQIIVGEIERLGGKIRNPPGKPRRYKESPTYIPQNIQEFCDAWRDVDSGTTYSFVKLGLVDVIFGQEFALKDEEYDPMPFFKERSDAIIIGDGKKLVVASMTDNSADFGVWLIEEQSEPIGPIPISEFLTGLTKNLPRETAFGE